MNTEELLGALKALPGAREVRVSAPLRSAVLVAGLEVAAASTSPERSLRRIWRDRHGGGATPLLLLCDDASRSGCVLALGAIDAGAPLRSVDAGALFQVFDRVASLPRLEAVREVAAELDRLDQAGIPGLKVRELLTLHTLDVRLRRDAARWPDLVEAVKPIGSGVDWKAVMTALGYELERRKHRGWLARSEGKPVVVIHPKADPAEFARLDSEGRPPEGVLLNDCRADGAEYGILSAGGRLRLFEVESAAGSASSRYIDLDAASLQEDDRPLLGLLSPKYLAESGFTELETEARAFGAELRQRLDDRIRQTVLPSLGRAFGQWARANKLDVTDDSIREDLERAALTLVFRALFILYAESAHFLPMENRSYQQASLSALVEEAGSNVSTLDPKSSSLWDRFVLLVKAMRTGNTAWTVPAYNGALFAPAGFEGAEILERLELTDPDFGHVLVGLGREPAGDQGLDYSTLEIGHLGHIYEGLLSLRLSVADEALQYDARRDRYGPAEPGEAPDIDTGDLLWQTHEGGRKGGGVYYTRTELVRHLVRQTVVPAFDAHLERVRKQAAEAPADAADELFNFAVLDPACGSAHFLVEVVNEIADMTVRFLGDVPLPKIAEALDRLRSGASASAVIDDVALLRRLVVKRCVFGVDLSLMGAEVAKLSLWLASFVPGLSLAYLDRNIQVGNSLVGVANLGSLIPSGTGQASWLADSLHEAIGRAAEAAKKIAESDDRTPDEIRASEDADAAARTATAALERLFDSWTAEPFGVSRAREEVDLHGPDILNGRTSPTLDAANEVARGHHFLHWPLAFPRAFSRARPGFDVVVGNPPWEELRVEPVFFYGLFRPGLHGLSDEAREEAIGELLRARPELEERLEREQERSVLERTYFGSSDYPSMAGDPDLYKFFSYRYRALLRDGGALGVVLPRNAFIADGSHDFREWLFEQTTCRRIDFLVNRRLWIFDTHPQWTVALVVAQRDLPRVGHAIELVGTATSPDEWEVQSHSSGVDLQREALGPGLMVPLLRNQEEADLLVRVRNGSLFPMGSGGRWKCFAVRELDETNDRRFWRGATEGTPLWKGESFDQYDPRGTEARFCPMTPAVAKKIRKPRPGSESIVAETVPLSGRRKAVLEELDCARVAFRGITRSTDSRTIRACLIPPNVLLANSSPYLAFVDASDESKAACLGIMNSLPFDWQARRFVEINLNYFILEGLIVPDLSDEDFERIAASAARLSCIDDRFADFADALGVEIGPLGIEEPEELRLEIDARVSRAWALGGEDLGIMLADFTLDAVPQSYRDKLIERVESLT